MADAPQRLEIDTVDFEVPCRRFTIRATITRDRQLPVVEEFLLRMLAVLDRVSIRRLRTWFGFTEAEMETVLIDLEGKAHVQIEGDDVLLAPAGRDLFRTTPEGGVPRLVEVAPLLDHVCSTSSAATWSLDLALARSTTLYDCRSSHWLANYRRASPGRRSRRTSATTPAV